MNNINKQELIKYLELRNIPSDFKFPSFHIVN